MNMEYVDATYWFVRNKKGGNISKNLFIEMKFQHGHEETVTQNLQTICCSKLEVHM